MRILLLIHRLWQGGGTETHVLSLANSLYQAGHTVHILTSGGGWVRKARNQGVVVHSVPRGQVPSQKLVHLCEKHKYDVLHAHDGQSLQVIIQARNLYGIRPKVAFTVHGLYVSKTALLNANRYAHAVVAVSPSVASYVRTFVNGQKVYSVLNGVNTSVFQSRNNGNLRLHLGIPKHAYVVGYAGRFTVDKIRLGTRITRLLRRYSAEHPDVHIIVAGRGAQKFFESKGRFHVLGHIENMPAFYRTCNVVIGTGRVAMESIATLRPTLCVGRSGWHGRVTETRLLRLARTNFGDQSISFRTLHPKTLYRELEYGRHHPRSAMERAQKVYKKAHHLLSLRRMTKETLTIYRSMGASKIVFISHR